VSVAPSADTKVQAELAVRLAVEHGFYLFPVDHPTATKRCSGVKTKEHNPDTCTERGKHPCCKWSEWSTNDAGLLVQNHYFGGRNAKNIGIDCGKSGLLVVDEDALHELARFCADYGVELPPTFTVRTANGSHIYFRQPDGEQLGNREGLFLNYQINIRGQGGFVVGPGSLHVDGIVYQAVDGVREIAPLLLLVVEKAHAIRVFCLHDADVDGYNIARVLGEETKRMPGHRVDVVNLVLSVADAVRLGLPTEEFTRRKALPTALSAVLTDLELPWFTGRRVSAKSCVGTRCELNAFTGPELIRYVEARLPDANTKVVPPAGVLGNTARDEHVDAVRARVDEWIAESLDVDAIVATLVAEFPCRDDGWEELARRARRATGAVVADGRRERRGHRLFGCRDDMYARFRTLLAEAIRDDYRR
jgi:hypothetical protein